MSDYQPPGVVCPRCGMTGEVMYFRVDSGEPALPGCGRCKIPMVLSTDPASPWVRMERLEAIVRDLAAVEDPTVFDNDDTTPSFVCGVCRMGGPGDATRTATADHAESCPWRRARDLRKTP